MLRKDLVPTDNALWVRNRLNAMKVRPLMWAYTKEAWIAQVTLLLEMLEMPRANFLLMYEFLEHKPGTTVWSGFGEPFEEEWAKEVINFAFEIINSKK